MTPRTLEEALQLVPEYMMPRTKDDGLKMVAIPQHVREAMAEMMLGYIGGWGPKNTDCANEVGRWLAGGEE